MRSNEGTLISGTMMTVPESEAASRRPTSCCSAMIDAYSVPCAPATSARTGPGFAPCTTATGIDSAASAPAGTSMLPVAVCPRAALAVPTVNTGGSCAARTTDAPVIAAATTPAITAVRPIFQLLSTPRPSMLLLRHCGATARQHGQFQI